MLPTDAAFLVSFIQLRLPKLLRAVALLSNMFAVVFDFVMLKMPSDERRELVCELEGGVGAGSGTKFNLQRAEVIYLVAFFKKTASSNQGGMLIDNSGVNKFQKL